MLDRIESSHIVRVAMSTGFAVFLKDMGFDYIVRSTDSPHLTSSPILLASRHIMNLTMVQSRNA